MKRLALLLVLAMGCADRALPDNPGTMESGGAGGQGSGGNGGSLGTGGTGGSAGQNTGGSGGGDMVDAGRPDGSRRSDAAAMGQSCGQVVLCAFQCSSDLTCIQGCCQMGTPEACQQAQSLLICAATSCASSISNPIMLFQCLQQSCPTQFSTCTGL